MAKSPETPRVTPLGTDPDGDGRSKGPPRVIALGASAVVAVALLVVVFGAGGGNEQSLAPTSTTEQPRDAAPPIIATTTTSTTLPPTLAAVAPSIGPSLTVVAGGPAPSLVRWTTDAEAPRVSALPEGLDWAAFDSSGDHLAFTNPDGLHLARSGMSGTLIAPTASGASWHAQLPGVIAFTATDAGGTTTISIAMVGSGEDGIESWTVADLPDGSRIAAWGHWGFAIEQPLPGTDPPARAVVVYDRTGRGALRAVPGIVVAAADDLLLVDGPEDGLRAMAVARAGGIAGQIMQPPEGTGLFDVSLTPTTLELDESPGPLKEVTIGPFGSLVALTHAERGNTSVTLVERNGGSSMVVPVRGAGTPVGFVAGGGYLVLHDRPAAELVLIEVETGRRARLSFEATPILAAHA
jgi:hypothetical protein